MPDDLIARVDALTDPELRALALAGMAARWIPCAERLPKAGVLVVARDAHGEMRVLSKIWENAVCPKLGYLGKLHDFTDHKLYGITHWTPLPEAPREVK